MISTYRLGDLFALFLRNDEQDEILTNYPNSIGSKFILEKRNNNCSSNIDIITKIILEHTEQNLHLLPKDIQDCTVIHVRLGDVVAGNEWHEKLKRPLEIDNIKSLLSNDNNKKYVIGKCFFAKTSSNNYNECINLSNKYLKDSLSALNAEHFDSGNADIDLFCAVKSKLFLQGRGFYSKLIYDVRTKLNLDNISSLCLTN